MTSFGVALIGAGVLLAAGILVILEARRQKKRSSPLASISTKATLEALIPAIKEIEGGYFENVSYFILEANKGLDRLSSQYRFESTSTIRRSWHVTGAYVDRITVIEITEPEATSSEGRHHA